MNTKSSGDLRLYVRLLRHARVCWPHLGGILGLSVISVPLGMLQPLPIKIAVDSVLGHAPLPKYLSVFVPESAHRDALYSLIAVAGFLLAVSLLAHLQQLTSWLLQTYTGEKLVLDFRAQLFSHAQRTSLSYHDSKGSADIAYRIQNDAPAIQFVTIQGLIPLFTATLTFVGMLLVMWHLHWQFAVLALALSPALFTLSRASSQRVRRRWDDVKQLDTFAMAVMHEALNSLRVVKAFGQESREDARFAEHSNARMQQQVRLAGIQASYHVMMGLTVAIGTAAALFMGVQHVRTGVMTLGSFLLALAYLTQLYEPLKTISTKMPELQGWLTSLERALGILDERSEVIERPNALPLVRARGEVEFRGATFVYGTGKTGIEEVSFHIKPGTRVGVIGPSGAGKSTLVGLLTRFYEATAGEVLLDGVDIREYRLADLRRQFGIVLQEPFLLSTSIAENIAYAKPGATADEVIAAAKAANIHHFIMSLPDGYATKIGERGKRLSGGERQRISLARAFLKDSPIMILDEPTSAVDVATEAAILDATDELLRGKTSFIIAHRLNTLHSCDLLLVMKDGRLVEATADVVKALEARGDLETQRRAPVLEFSRELVLRR